MVKTQGQGSFCESPVKKVFMGKVTSSPSPKKLLRILTLLYYLSDAVYHPPIPFVNEYFSWSLFKLTALAPTSSTLYIYFYNRSLIYSAEQANDSTLF